MEGHKRLSRLFFGKLRAIFVTYFLVVFLEDISFHEKVAEMMKSVRMTTLVLNLEACGSCIACYEQRCYSKRYQ